MTLRRAVLSNLFPGLEFPTSDPCRRTGCPDRDFLCFFGPTTEMAGECFEIGHDHFLTSFKNLHNLIPGFTLHSQIS